jgi:integrase
VRYLSPEERGRLLLACQRSSESRLYPLVVVALGTGGRQGELLDLRWGEVDLARGQAVVDGKNGERRALALIGPTAAALRDLARVRRLGTDLVFASFRGVAAFPRKAWERALADSKVQDFHFHDLRHTFASYLAMSGASLPELAAALGHKTLAMVQRYAHLAPAHTAGVVRRMTEKFLS